MLTFAPSVECSSPVYARTVELNGVVVGSFSPAYWCSCTPQTPLPTVTVPLPVAYWRRGAANAVSVSVGSSCAGFAAMQQAQALFGGTAFAVVNASVLGHAVDDGDAVRVAVGGRAAVDVADGHAHAVCRGDGDADTHAH